MRPYFWGRIGDVERGHKADIQVTETLEVDLRRAYKHLYDMTYLRQSPLIERLGLTERDDPSLALQELLRRGLELLRPADDAPETGRAWRRYQIMQLRFCEQMTQQAAAVKLGLATRHLRREQTAAIAAIASHIKRTLGISELSEEQAGDQPSAYPRANLLGREMAHLAADLQGKISDLIKVMAQARELTGPLAQERGIVVRQELAPGPLGTVRVPEAVLKQALLNLLSVGLERAEDTLRITLGERERGVSVDLSLQTGAWAGDAITFSADMLAPFGGRIDTSDDACCLTIWLPLADHAMVLAIEDSADTLDLWRRYLTDTRFLLVEAGPPEQAVQRAVGLRPQLILLDVMMPGVDGWQVLSQLKAQEALAGTPVVVCTILPQESLARTLGANGFIRKPIMGQAFREALERQIAAS